jgi:hypothetical protein
MIREIVRTVLFAVFAVYVMPKTGILWGSLVFALVSLVVIPPAALTAKASDSAAAAPAPVPPSNNSEETW